MPVKQIATTVATPTTMQNIIEELRTYPIKSIIKVVRQYKHAPDVYEDALSGKIKYLADFTDEPVSIFNPKLDIKEQLLNLESLPAKTIELFSAVKDKAENKKAHKIVLKQVQDNIEIRGYNKNEYCVLKRDPYKHNFNNELLKALKNTLKNKIELFRD